MAMKIKIVFLLALIVVMSAVIMVRADETESALTQDEIQYVNDNLDILYDSGIFKGYPGGEFNGENSVTRFETGAVLTRFYGYLLDEMNARGIEVMDFIDIRSPLDNPMDMTDIPENHWAYEELLRLEHMGVAGGYPDLEYKGPRNIDRYQFSSMLLRVVVLVDFGLWEAEPGYNGGFTETHFAKPETIEGASEDYWARTDVRRLIDTGEVEIAADGTVAGGMPFTRNEMAFVILNLMDKFSSELDKLAE